MRATNQRRANRSLARPAKGRAPLLVVLLLLLLCAPSALAVSLTEYRSRVERAADAMEAAAKRGPYEDGPAYLERVNRALDSVERNVPSEEMVDFEGGKVRVNNSWLEDELKSFRALPQFDPRGSEILTRVAERLRAQLDRMNELEPALGSATAKAKEEEKARLEEILRRAEYEEKPQGENVLQRLWRRFLEWWNGLFPRQSGLQPGQMSWLSFIAMILAFGAAGVLLGYAAWKVLPFFRRRRAKSKPEKGGARVVLGERLSPEQTAADILKEAEALAREGQLRAAIRKGYIALLCELGDRKVLTLARHKTNRDYLRAVRGKRPLLDEMQKLTSSFENHWYGDARATPDDWSAFLSGYEKVISNA